MPTLHIDFETRSAVDLKKTGVYRYAEDPSTDIWCAAYAVDDEPVKLWAPTGFNYCSDAGWVVPLALQAAVREGWPIVAHNANFERAIFQYVMGPRYGWPVPRTEQWRCTMAMALAMSLPGSLESASSALGLSVGKDKTGHALMMRMARPRNIYPPDVARGMIVGGKTQDGQWTRLSDGTLYEWWAEPEKRQRLYEYCKMDVEVERQLEKRLLALRPSELKLWHLDQTINDRGVYVDVDLCEAAKKIVKVTAERLNAEMAAVTDYAVRACSNAGQLIAWLRENGLDAVESIAKDQLDALLKRDDLAPAVRRALELRQEAAKASVAKIDALLLGRSSDGRAKGLLQYHAASTGRWGGRRFQPQNIKRPTLEDVDEAIDDVLTGDADRIELLYGAPLSVVGDCLRGMIAAQPGKKIMAADYSNIEGRVIAWLAGEDWKIQAFRDFDAKVGHDLYKLAYARSFGISPADVTKEQRQIGKVMELALGYQGGVGAFQTMARGYGVKVPDKQADELKVAWRAAHPKIKQFWYDLEQAAIDAVERPGAVVTVGKIAFRKVGSFLFMRLPSGRALTYPYPRVIEAEVPWGGTRPALVYKGVDVYTRKWGDIQTYGGELANNAVQGTARDVMAEAVVRLEEAGYPVILTVHDEVVSEVEEDFGSVEHFEELMTTLPAWADGLPIASSGFAARRYRK